MEKTLYIHIGGPKTGTTALQHFFSINRQVLRDKGFLYPGERESHWGIATELDLLPEGGVYPGMQRQLPGLLEEISGSRCAACVLSAEDLAILGGAAAMRSLIPKTFAVRIIYYARRQDDLFESRYNEFVKGPIYRVKEKLDEDFVDSFYQRMEFDHLHVVTRWAEAFGKDSIIIRCYEKSQIPGGIIEDFCRIIGLQPDNALKIPAGQINRSLDIHHTEFIRLCNRYFHDMPEINEYLYRKQFNDSRALGHLPVQHRLSPKTRIEILNHYEESNRRLAKEFLGREDGRLFYEPWPDPSGPWEPYQGLSLEELVPILTDMIHTAEMRREIQRQELQPLISCLEILNHLLKKVMLFIPKGVKRPFQEKSDRWYNRK